MSNDNGNEQATDAAPSRVRVADGGLLTERDPMPGHLYFCRASGFKGKIPEDQESARQALDDFASVLRISLQDQDPVRFKEFFTRLLTIAQATFEPAGFNPATLNELPSFKREVVQVAGAAIKARYTAKLFWHVLIASVVALIVGVAGEVVEERANAAAGRKAVAIRNRESPTDEQVPGERRVAPTSSFSILNTGCLLAASFWGLLFASMTRSIEPTFEKLLTPDADLMQPWFRILFYSVPVLVISLLFQVEAVTISFGERVSTSQVDDDLVIAVLVGLLLGIAERALPSEVEHWSKRILPSSNAGAA